MGYEFVRYEKQNHIATVTIDRPDVRNAVHPPANEEMARVWDDFAADPDCWVAILTGTGEKAFSAGNDLKWTAEHGTVRLPKSGLGGLTARTDLDKPLIAAVNGFALGGGFEMALACDVVIAAEHATFGLPEPRVGLVAAAGGIHRLPRHIPLKIAMGMMLTARPITAARAAELGLVNEVTTLADLLPTAHRWVEAMLECSPLSLQATKHCALGGLGKSLPDAMNGDGPMLRTLFTSEDAKEGPRAFAAKRKPNWKGV